MHTPKARESVLNGCRIYNTADGIGDKPYFHSINLEEL